MTVALPASPSARSLPPPPPPPTTPQSTYSQFHTYVLCALAGRVRKESDGVCQYLITYERSNSGSGCRRTAKQWLISSCSTTQSQVVAYFVLQYHTVSSSGLFRPAVPHSLKYQLAVSRLFASTQKTGCEMSNTPINVVIVQSVNELTNHMDFLKSKSDFI